MREPLPTFRFAPSPTGELHVGHALSALVGWRWARRLDGRFLLRIEDIDVGRTREAFVAQIFEDLAWLGLDWEEPVLRQSEHFDTYQSAIDRLRSLGVLYPCFATRREIADAVVAGGDHATDPDGVPLYPGRSKVLGPSEEQRREAAGEPFALRLDMARALDLAMQRSGGKPLTYQAITMSGQAQTVTAAPERWGDAVIMRKDVAGSYHLCVVVDDARQGVSHVTRGMDLEAATDLHRLLQVLLDLPAPLYHHHALILDRQGRKFSKRDRAVSLRSLREAGRTAADVLAMIDDIYSAGS